MQDSAPNSARRLGGLLFLAWIGLVVMVFILVMIPAESGLAQALPTGFWRLRDMIYPLFYSRSVYG